MNGCLGSLDPVPVLGVVPIFVNTGAALLPAVVAALATVLGLLMRPRELWQLCRTRPWIPLAVVAAAVLGYFLIAWALAAAQGRPAAPGQDPPPAAGTPAARTDWAAVALELIRREERDWQQAWLQERERRELLEQRVAELEARLAERADGAPVRSPAAPTDEPNDPRPSATIFRGDASRCGYAGSGSPRELKPFWESRSPYAMVMASPIVVGGAVYAAACALDPPNNRGAVICLDAVTGQQRWSTEEYRDPASGQRRQLKAIFSSPAVSADGRDLVIGQGLHFDQDCALICLNTQTGTVRWAVPTPLHIESSPAIAGDLVVAGAGAVEGDALQPLGDPGYVFAVRISDGRLIWKYPVPDPESSPAIADGVVYIGSGWNGNAVVALRIASDQQLQEQGLERLVWKTPAPHPAVGAVTLAGDMVLIGCGNSNYVYMAAEPEGCVLALDRATGAIRWRVDLSSTVLGPIAARNGRAVCAVLDGEILALDLNDRGRVLWRQRLRERALLKAGPALTEDFVYAVTHDGYLYVLDAAAGTVLEEHDLNHPDQPGELGLATSSPFLADGRLYVGSETGGLRCFVGQDVR